LLLVAVLVGAAGVGFLIIATAALLVTVGVHQEERRMTFTRRRGPTAVSRLTRLIVGRYVRATDPEPAGPVPPKPEPPKPEPPKPEPPKPGPSEAALPEAALPEAGHLAVAPPGVGCSH
jgi:hypothetical protein